MIDFASLSVAELLAAHAQIGDELRTRGVVRSANNPVGDLSELLFCRAYAWQQAGNSAPSADAVSADGKRYQIKGRRLTPHNGSRQLSALRNLPDGGFDFLAGALFGDDYSIMRAAIIPHALVVASSKYVEHTNSWIFHLRDSVWTWPGVFDATADLRAVKL